MIGQGSCRPKNICCRERVANPPAAVDADIVYFKFFQTTGSLLSQFYTNKIIIIWATHIVCYYLYCPSNSSVTSSIRLVVVVLYIKYIILVRPPIKEIVITARHILFRHLTEMSVQLLVQNENMRFIIMVKNLVYRRHLNTLQL